MFVESNSGKDNVLYLLISRSKENNHFIFIQKKIGLGKLFHFLLMMCMMCLLWGIDWEPDKIAFRLHSTQLQLIFVPSL